VKRPLIRSDTIQRSIAIDPDAVRGSGRGCPQRNHGRAWLIVLF
jgi:hypothetical protein